jgi:hypothetical protein
MKGKRRNKMIKESCKNYFYLYHVFQSFQSMGEIQQPALTLFGTEMWLLSNNSTIKAQDNIFKQTFHSCAAVFGEFQKNTCLLPTLFCKCLWLQLFSFVGFQIGVLQ